MRGADVLIKSLSDAGVRYIFTLSGNQIMSAFDASIDSGIELIHVRHEASAVHMADAWGRLTGQPGVALVTAGPGMGNTVSALYVALMSESPLLLLSGHAPESHVGLGGFQEMAQTDMASKVTKSSLTANNPALLGAQVTQALGIASSGRPGPVHISIPVNILESNIDQAGPNTPNPDHNIGHKVIEDSDALTMLDSLSKSERPLLLTGSAMMRGQAPDVLKSFTEKTSVPVISMESPRGIDDPSLGKFAEILSQSDLIILLGKKLDFTLQMGQSPTFNPSSQFIQIDAEETVLNQTHRILPLDRIITSIHATPLHSFIRLTKLSEFVLNRSMDWHDEVQNSITYRPASWKTVRSTTDGGLLHTIEVCREVNTILDCAEESILISDGGEFGQWAQACVSANRRLINGPGGAIGASVPFAATARLAFPNARIIAMMGDGAFGFHAMELDTAVRYNLPFVAVVGNDGKWNAEHQVQLKNFGVDRLVGCDLLPSRYDQISTALGGYGENVSTVAELGMALKRSLDSAKPATINVAIHSDKAPALDNAI